MGNQHHSKIGDPDICNMQILNSAAAAAVISPFTYHTERLSLWIPAGYPHWRRVTASTNEISSLCARLLKKIVHGGGMLKSF